jgi:hypothetical protein
LRVGCNVLLAEHRQRSEGLASQKGPETRGLLRGRAGGFRAQKSGSSAA